MTLTYLATFGALVHWKVSLLEAGMVPDSYAQTSLWSSILLLLLTLMLKPSNRVAAIVRRNTNECLV